MLGREELREILAVRVEELADRGRRAPRASRATSCATPGSARLALWTAASTSSTDARSTAPVWTPAAGLKTGPLRPDVPSTRAPSIQCGILVIVPSRPTVGASASSVIAQASSKSVPPRVSRVGFARVADVASSEGQSVRGSVRHHFLPSRSVRTCLLLHLTASPSLLCSEARDCALWSDWRELGTVWP